MATRATQGHGIPICVAIPFAAQPVLRFPCGAGDAHDLYPHVPLRLNSHACHDRGARHTCACTTSGHMQLILS